MRIVVIAVVGVSLVAAIAGGLIWLQPKFRLAPTAYVCQFDDAVAADEREAVESAARGFVETMFGSHPGDAFDLMSAYGQTDASREQLEAAGHALQADGVGALTVRRTFVINGAGGSREGVMIACGGAPGAVDFVRKNDALKQAHVLLTYPLNAGAKSVAVWLVFERGRWRVNYAYVNFSQILDSNARDLFEQAQDQRAQGHVFNAFFLYRTAANLAHTGAHLQLGDFAQIGAAESSFPAPAEMQGAAPPYHWTLDGRTFDYEQWGYFGAANDHKVVLRITRTLPFNDDSDAEAQNRVFLDAVMKTYPEWRQTFDGITVRTHKPGADYAWNTLFQKDGGYDEPPRSGDQPARSEEAAATH
ncbi:MAG TPA: hypothetical protein VG841_11910 [Caulobacterales bacterium]|nr:hypothetical protein [Caulobacterales bacterium]